MRVEYFTLVMQFIILFAVAGSAWWAFRTSKSTKQTTDLIRQYRSEITWLTARIEALEGKANGRRERA
jgi:hypothetical protein